MLSYGHSPVPVWRAAAGASRRYRAESADKGGIENKGFFVLKSVNFINFEMGGPEDGGRHG